MCLYIRIFRFYRDFSNHPIWSIPSEQWVSRYLARSHKKSPNSQRSFSEAVWILLLIAWWVFSWSCKEAATKLGKFHLVETCINIYTCMGLCILDRMLFGSQDHLPQQKIMYNNHPPEAWQYKSASDKMASERATAWVDWIVLGLVADSSFFSNCNHWHIMLSDLSHKVRVVVFSGGPFRSSHIHVRFHHLTTYMQGGQSSTKMLVRSYSNWINNLTATSVSKP